MIRKNPPKFGSILGFFLHPKIPKNYVAMDVSGLKDMDLIEWYRVLIDWRFLLHGAMVVVVFFKSPEDRLLFGVETQTQTSVPLEQEGKRLVCVFCLSRSKRWRKKMKRYANKKYCMRICAVWIYIEVYPCSSLLMWFQLLPAIFSAALNIWSPKFPKPFKAVGVHRSFIMFFCSMWSRRPKEGGRPVFFGSQVFPPWCLSI